MHVYSGDQQTAKLFDGVPDWRRPEVKQLIRRDLIVGDHRNPRRVTSLGEMNQLIASVRQEGIRKAVEIRRGENPCNGILKSGHRRMFAAETVGLEYVPCELDPSPFDEAKIHRELILCNEHQVPPPPIDKAKSYEAYRALKGYNQMQLAADLNIPQPTISALLILLKLPELTQKHVNEGHIPISTAQWLARVDEPEHVILHLTERLVAGELYGKHIRAIAQKKGLKRQGSMRSNRRATTAVVPQNDGEHGLKKTERTFSLGGERRIVVTVSCRYEMTDDEISAALMEARGSLMITMPKAAGG